MTFTGITVDPGQIDVVPCIRRVRIPVPTVVVVLADALTANGRGFVEAYVVRSLTPA